MASEFSLDHRFCQYGTTAAGEFTSVPDRSPFPEVGLHNSRVSEAIDALIGNRPSFAIIDKGRTVEERSCVWVEDGHFYGMGYFPTDTGFNEPAQLKEYMTRYKSNHYMMQLIYAYARRHLGKLMFRKNF